MVKSGVTQAGIYDAKDMAAMQGAIDAVCAELGVKQTDHQTRERVADHVIRSWAKGHRTPLHLVHAGLNGGARLSV